MMSGLGLTFLRRGGQAHPTAGSDYILSENRGDPEVFRILMSKGVSSDGIGITIADAAQVTSIAGWFRGNTIIESFNELRYFTSLTSLYGTTTSNGEFYQCTNLRSVVLPESMTSIGASAFGKCESLISIGATPNVTTVGNGAFEGCSALSVDLNFPKLKTLGFSALRMSGIISFTAETFAHIVQANTFEACPNLISVSIPLATRIENTKAFYQCRALKNVDISSVAYAGNMAFEECSGLETLNAPSLQTTGFSVFRGLTSLKWAKFGSTLTNIGANGIENATSLQYMIFESANPPALYNATTINNTNNCPIYVPDASLAAYQSANIWKNVVSRIKPLSEFNG